MSNTVWSAIGGLVIGLLFGATMQRARFCMVAAVTNVIVLREYRYTQAFIAAWVVAIAGTAALESAGIVHIAESAYRTGPIDWLGAIGGGLVFGFGATLAGGCAARTLVNAAEGQLGGWLALLTMTIFAGITQYGALAPARTTLLSLTALSTARGDSGIAVLLHLPTWLIATIVAVVGAWLIVKLGAVAANRNLILAGATIGLLAVLAWLLTGWIAQDEFAPTAPTSIKITGPLARIYYTVTARSDFDLGFGTSFVFGVACGAAISALLSGTFHWTRARTDRIVHHLAGGALMGVGATFAGGCNIGQGVAGVSTLSLTSILAALAIFCGAALGIAWYSRRA